MTSREKGRVEKNSLGPRVIFGNGDVTEDNILAAREKLPFNTMGLGGTVNHQPGQ